MGSSIRKIWVWSLALETFSQEGINLSEPWLPRL